MEVEERKQEEEHEPKETSEPEEDEDPADSKPSETSGEAPDLNLDDLASYKMSELKDYCTHHGIDAKGRRKQVFIDAILEFNKKD
jgi:hypothetical protein